MDHKINETVSQISSSSVNAYSTTKTREFPIELFKRLSNSSNLVFSPASISIALSMAAIGSGGESRQAFQQLFGFSEVDELIEQVKSIQNSMKQSEGAQCLIANKIYQGLKEVRAEYSALMQSHFSSSIESVRFEDNPNELRLQINAWAKNATLDKVSDLLPNDSITLLTRMVLVNAIYFKGSWETPFDKKETQEQDFKLAYNKKGESVKVPFMNRCDQFEYFQDKNGMFQYVQIPFAGKSQYAMEVILPTEIQAFENSFQLNHLEDSRKNKHNTKLDLFLPRFNIGSAESTSLKEILSAMGLADCFSNKADFSFMDPENTIRISDVFHKAVIEVNEEGAEATASSGVQIQLKTFPTSMKCDRPFIYAITHIPTSNIIFLGKLVDPSEQ